MSDVAWQWGGDLSLGPTGDLATVTAQAFSQQRVLARLLTNAGDYIWHLDYGAGLAQYVGAPQAPQLVGAAIRYQLALEATVAASPPPAVNAVSNTDGTMTLGVNYASPGQSVPVALSFNL